MTAIDITTLEASVEALIRQQVAVYEMTLREAIGRKLTSGRSGSSSRRTATNLMRPPRRAAAPAPRPTATRRTSADLEELAERIFNAVEATPGETMMTLAARLGLSSQELHGSVLRLKKAGRIRMVGERNRARYYPMTPRSS